MRSFVSCLIAFCFVSASIAMSTTCGPQLIGKNIYDLCDLQNNQYNASVAPFQNVTFGLGKAQVQNCHNNGTEWALMRTAGAVCQDIATQDPTYDLINENDADSGVSITFPNNTEGVSLKVNLKCDSGVDSADKIVFTNQTYEIKNGLRYVTVEGGSNQGCPKFSFIKILNFVYAHAKIFAGCFIVFGLILAFLGLKLFTFLIFILASLIGFVTLLVLVSLIFPHAASQTWYNWVVGSISAILGLGLGYLTVRFWRISYFIIGASLGLVVGSIVYYAAVAPIIKEGTHQAYAYWGILGGAALIGGIIILLLGKSIVMLSTATVGAYIIVRSISVFAGGFPSESTISQGFKVWTPVVYAYLVGLIVVAVAGFIVQLKHNAKSASEEEIPKPVGGNQGYYRV